MGAPFSLEFDDKALLVDKAPHSKHQIVFSRLTLYHCRFIDYDSEGTLN
jgi:hypothetical protein